MCFGRIRESHPIYLPRKKIFTKKLVQRVHCETLHGGIGLTMAAVRERYWISRLRSLVKLVRKKCWGCKKFQQTPFTPPVAGQLPDDRITPGTAFQVIGVDFAGPIKFRESTKAEEKAYLCIFACSLSRAIHLEPLHNHRGRPSVISSDNGGAFIKASKWLEQLRKDENLRGLTKEYEIKWKFNLSRAP